MNILYNLSNEVIFLKEYLIDMTDNLLYLNKIKIYENTNISYNLLYNELILIKKQLEIIPDKITDSYLFDNKLTCDDISNKIDEIKKIILRYSNHIAPTNMNNILKLYIGNNWKSLIKFNPTDMEKLMLMIRLFNPIMVWDSYYHMNKIDYIDYTDNIRPSFDKNVFNTIIDSKNEKMQSITIGNVSAFPKFLKNLSDIIIKDKKQTKQDRVIHYNYKDILKLFKNNTNIIICKNSNCISLIEEKQGFMIIIKLIDRVIVMQGITKDDIMELYKTTSIINDMINNINHYLEYDIITVTKSFKKNYVNILNIRDIIINSKEEIGTIIKKKYNDYKQLKTYTLPSLINEFLLASKFRKYEFLVLFLLGSTQDNKIGYLLYDILKMKDKTLIYEDIYNSLHISLKVKLDNTETNIMEEELAMIQGNIDDITYERRITVMNIDQSIKNKVIDKIKSLKNNFQGDNKAQTWLDGFFKLPLGIYRENKLMTFKNKYIEMLNATHIYSQNEIEQYIETKSIIKDDWIEYKNKKRDYLKNVRSKLNETVYGHMEAKLQLERLLAQWMNGETKGYVIGLCGPPGTGKTSLVKNGLSQGLMDDNMRPRPFGFIPIGGSSNGSTLIGHNYTYVGSTWGRIVDILITAECMNPIIFIDEIDKVSGTEYGKEIVSILTHLTDMTQNDSFEDKYFSGIMLDLSKAIIVFSFNDINMIDPILRDRITIIETKAYSICDKINIIKDYMFPSIMKDVGFSKGEIILNDETIKYIINTYTNEAGVRKIKEKLVDIVRDINLTMIQQDNIIYPYIVTNEYIDNLFINKPKVRINMIHTIPSIGIVNGMYATSSGVGGLTPIQVMKYPSEKMLDLTITGQQGDVMKESVDYALRIAYNMLPDDIKNKILEDSKNKNNFGLIVHTPDAGTKKDGPSAGVAMTLAIYSILMNKVVSNTISMTGEIDLWQNVRAIGGVGAKLYGAKNSGIKIALIPKENMEDMIILRNEGSSPEDDNFKVIFIDTLKDVIDICII